MNTMTICKAIACFLLCYSMTADKSFAQSKTIRDINDATATAKEIKGLFGGGKKKKKAETPTTETSSGAENPSSSSKNKNKSQSIGELSPSARTLSFDELGRFDFGAAIVRKGSSRALIDRHGNIIRPFTTKPLRYGSETMFTGFFIEGESDKTVLLNARGKQINPANSPNFSISTDGKYAIFMNGKNYKLIDTSGRTVYSFSEGFFKNSNPGPYVLSIRENIGIWQGTVPGDPRLYFSYLKTNGAWLTMEEFVDAEPFSEGMACVGKMDEYGTLKYGFIDKDGKIAIPFTYSKKPGSFHNGLACVIPAGRSDFAAGFINKKGELVIKCKYPFSDFYKGFSFYGDYMLDTAGNMQKFTEFLSGRGVKFGPRDGANPYENDPAHGNYRIANNKYLFVSSGLHKEMGYFDVTNANILPGSFDVGGNAKHGLWFDPVSTLSYAEYYLGKDASGRDQWRKGYINAEGVFMMVLGDADKW